MPATLNESARGVYVICVTPFTDDGALDLASTATMVEFMLARGVDGLTVLGILGEATKLTADESERFVARVLDVVAGQVPVVVGVLQDPPVSTGVQMPVSAMLRIVAAHPTCVMIKHEECPGLAKLSAMRAASQRGEVRRVSILTGNGGGLFLPEELSRGADGAMTGFAYPEMMVDVCREHAGGDVERAHDLFDAYLPLARYEQQAGIGLAVRKHLLRQRGAIASAALRRPGPRLGAADVADIERLVARQARRLAQLD